MALREEFVQVGNRLFKWRSYLPLVMIVLFIPALRDFHYPLYSYTLDQLWKLFSLCISFLGLGIRIFTVGRAPAGTSGRNTKEQSADVLNTTGMYSIVRHPLYLGNFLIWLGISLSVRVWWFVAIGILIYWLYYERIMFAEEEFLRRKFGEDYLKWAEKTPAFLPRLKNWRPFTLPSSLRTILKREHSGFFGIISTFTFLEVIEQRIAKGLFILNWIWGAIFIFGLITYITLVILKKKTSMLKVEGR